MLDGLQPFYLGIHEIGKQEVAVIQSAVVRVCTAPHAASIVG